MFCSETFYNGYKNLIQMLNKFFQVFRIFFQIFIVKVS